MCQLKSFASLPNIGFYGKKFGRGINTPIHTYLSHTHTAHTPPYAIQHTTHDSNINQQPLLTNNSQQSTSSSTNQQTNNIINKHKHMIHKIRQKDAEYLRPIFSAGSESRPGDLPPTWTDMPETLRHNSTGPWRTLASIVRAL